MDFWGRRGFLLMLRVFSTVFFLSALALLANGEDDLFSEFSGETSLSLGYGYAENALYSELAPVDAAFTVANVEGFFERTLLDGSIDWNAMLFVDHRIFHSDEEIPDQTLVLAQTQFEGYVGLYSKWRVGARYLNLEQAFDATFDALERNSFLVTAEEPEVLFGWESFFWTFAYDAELGFSRMSFAQEGSDYDSLNWKIDVDQRINDQLSWRSGVFGYERNYVDRLGRDLSGGVLADSLLGMSQLGFETGLVWSTDADWLDQKLSVMLSQGERSDAQFGYYDRRRRAVEVLWRGEWESRSLVLRADYGEYRYENRLGDDGLIEGTDAWSWSLEFEQKLSESWSAFVWLNEEEEESNASFSSYDSRSVSIGLKWLK